MNIYLSKSGGQIPGDLIQETVLRSDLAPVPRTLELTVQLKDDMQQRLAMGASLWGGYEHLEYTIVMRERAQPTGVIQGDTPMQAMKVTAFLTSCQSIGRPREPGRAVTAYNQSLGSVYRACGSSLVIANDFTVGRFVCLAGDTPSHAVAVALQEEGAALVLREGRISIERLHNLMAQTPTDSLGQFDSSAAHESDLLEQVGIPMCISIDDYGNVVKGDFGTARNARFIPGMDARTLHNLSHVPITRRIIDNQLAMKIRAGDVVSVAGKTQLVITAAHRSLSNNGIMDTSSRFWVGEIS